jgi:hypothetical protein
VYLIAGNTALFILILQFAAHAAIVSYQAVARRMVYERPNQWALQQSPDLTEAEVQELWRLTGWLPFRFGGGAGFLQDETTSRYLNINRFGIRSNGDPDRPMSALNNATWFFGGSTTFGFGVQDHDTIPAQLERLLGAPVINLGVRGHGSSMENRLFEYYLRAGYRPARAMFLDGINEICDPDLFSEEMTRLTERVQGGYRPEFGKPVVVLAEGLFEKLRPAEPTSTYPLSCDHDGRVNPLRDIIARILAERASTCALYKVDCRTFVQPFAGVHGRHDDQAFLRSVEAREFRELFAHLEPVWRAAGATFVTTALDGVAGHPWVDPIHYNPEASLAIAKAIAAQSASGQGATP